MAEKLTIHKTISLAGTENGVIQVGKLQEPYGENSEEVVSIAVSLNSGKDIDWKVHIPIKNLNELIKTLQGVQK